MTAACRYVEGQGRLTSRHDRYCNTSGCEGCEPCRDDHCGMPNCDRHLSEHEPLVCTRCVGKVRDNLKRVVELCTLTPFAAAETGRINTLAEVIDGPVPERSSWLARKDYVTSGAACRCANRGTACPDLQAYYGPACASATCKHTTCGRVNGMRVCPDFLAWTETADDERHPLLVLGSWDMAVAEHLGHRRTLRVTIPTAAAYLSGHLTDLARDQDFAFDELAREIHDTLRHVEDSLALTLRPTKGAPCPACKDAGRKPAKQLERKFADRTDDSKDQWVCPTKACGKVYELDEYDATTYKDWLENSDKLTAAQMLAQYRVPEGTLRRWANGWTDRFGIEHAATVRKRGYDGQRRQLYDVADVKRMRDSDAA